MLKPCLQFINQNVAWSTFIIEKFHEAALDIKLSSTEFFWFYKSYDKINYKVISFVLVMCLVFQKHTKNNLKCSLVYSYQPFNLLFSLKINLTIVIFNDLKNKFVKYHYLSYLQDENQ